MVWGEWEGLGSGSGLGIGLGLGVRVRVRVGVAVKVTDRARVGFKRWFRVRVMRVSVTG